MDDASANASTQSAGFASLFVRRPVLAIVLNLLILVAGAAAILGVEVRELPNIDRPVITVRTDYDGATPETVDKEITAVVEGAVARTPGVDSISSRSSAGESRVTIEFSESTDLNVAANDLRDAIGGLRSLPDDADAPVVVKADADSDAIMRLSVTSRTRPIDELTKIVNDTVVDRLASIDGRRRRHHLRRSRADGPHHRRSGRHGGARAGGGRPDDGAFECRARRARRPGLGRHPDAAGARRRQRQVGRGDRRRQDQPDDAGQRRRRRRLRPGRREYRAAHERRDRRRHGAGPAGRLEHPRHLDAGPSGGRRAPGVAAGRRLADHHLRRCDLHQRRHRRGHLHAAARHRDRRRRDLHLPALGARHLHSGDHRSDRADRHGRRDLPRRLLDQHPDAARPRPGDRHGGRRRDRRGREHLAAAAPRPRAARRGGARHQAGVLRRHLDNRDACGGLHPDLLLSRHGRAALLGIRLRPRLRRAAVVGRGADHLPDARLPLDRRRDAPERDLHRPSGCRRSVAARSGSMPGC